jgi:hypothetical protein
MPTLERIRDLYPDVPPPIPETRERARLALVARTARRSRPPRHRLLFPVAGLAVAAAAVVIALVGVGNKTGIDARAAAMLRAAAAKAKAQKTLGHGHVLYVKSSDAYLSSWPEQGWSVLEPHQREIWIGPDGAGRLRTSTGKSRFLSERDRRNWIAAGRPALPGGTSDDTPIPPADRSPLPSDPDALFELLKARASGHSEGTYPEMFTLAGDAFRDTNLSPAQRAALYEVVARIPGVELVGNVKDPVGRRGVAVAIDHRTDGIRHTLVIDPDTGTMLAEEQVLLEKNLFGYPGGTLIGHSTYLVTAMVPSVGARPK